MCYHLPPVDHDIARGERGTIKFFHSHFGGVAHAFLSHRAGIRDQRGGGEDGRAGGGDEGPAIHLGIQRRAWASLGHGDERRCGCQGGECDDDGELHYSSLFLRYITNPTTGDGACGGRLGGVTEER